MKRTSKWGRLVDVFALVSLLELGTIGAWESPNQILACISFVIFFLWIAFNVIQRWWVDH
jgi:hypothetical protein